MENKEHIREDKLFTQREALFGQKYFFENRNLSSYSDYDENTFTFKKLMIKLVFEQLLVELQHNQNFELIYEFIKAYGNDLQCIKLDLIDKTHLKSNHYWLLAVLRKLTKVKSIKIFKSDNGGNFGKDGFKFMEKGFTVLQKCEGNIVKFEINQGL